MTERLFYITLLMLLALAVNGCATSSDQLQGKNYPAAYHYQMGLSYLGERNYTGALVALTEAERLDPKNPEVLYNLGLAFIGKKRPDLAEQRLQQALILKPSYSAARNDLGVVYLDGKFYYHAWNSVYCGKWVEVDPTFGQAPADAARLRLVEGDLSQQTRLLSAFGNLKIEILEHQP